MNGYEGEAVKAVRQIFRGTCRESPSANRKKRQKATGRGVKEYKKLQRDGGCSTAGGCSTGFVPCTRGAKPEIRRSLKRRGREGRLRNGVHRSGHHCGRALGALCLRQQAPHVHGFMAWPRAAESQLIDQRPAVQQVNNACPLCLNCARWNVRSRPQPSQTNTRFF
jgi:hypothetical protein